MAPVLEGWMRVVRAWIRGEAAAPWQQAWRDLVRLWRKPAMAPAGASFVFLGAPAVALGAAVVAALLTPGFCLGMATGEASDLVVVAGLLGLSRAVSAVAAFDVGGRAVWVEGRETAAWAPALSVLLLAALVVVLLSGGTALDAAGAAVRDGAGSARIAGALTGFALLTVFSCSEHGVREAGLSGRAAAVLVGAGQVRRVVGLSVAALVGMPFGVSDAGAGLGAGAVGVACWMLKLGVLAAVSVGLRRREWLVAGGLMAVIAALVLGVQGRV